MLEVKPWPKEVENHYSMWEFNLQMERRFQQMRLLKLSVKTSDYHHKAILKRKTGICWYTWNSSLSLKKKVKKMMEANNKKLYL